MIEKIKKIILNSKDIDGWKITENRVKSSELFFIKKKLDMNRGKNVNHFKVTVYKDFEEGGIKYRGSSTANIHPSMDELEIKKAIGEALFAAGFVKNKYYPLVKPSDSKQAVLESNFSKAPLSDWLPGLTEAIFKADLYEQGWINSAELFLNRIYTRIVNSEGVDVAYEGYKGELEFITNWKGEAEEIELYKQVGFADFTPEMITQEVKNMLTISREKAMAKPTPALNKHIVLLTGEPVKEFFKYYYSKSNTQYVYEKISTAKVSENIQGKDIKGDLINIKLDPFVDNSTGSAPYDDDGFPLNPVTIFENGVLTRYWGNSRYSYYLDVKPTGLIRNLVVRGGSKSVETFKKEPYLELIAFSDFQMDPLTGEFAGEIRLGRYYDGTKTIPVTGGSISGNIREVQQEMYFSKEIQRDNNFIGPKTIQLFNVSIAGNC